MRLAPTAFALASRAPVSARHGGAKTFLRMLSAAAPGPKVRGDLVGIAKRPGVTKVPEVSSRVCFTSIILNLI